MLVILKLSDTSNFSPSTIRLSKHLLHTILFSKISSSQHAHLSGNIKEKT